MSVNLGQAVGYLDLDTTKFKTGIKTALADLKSFQSASLTSKDKLAAFGSAAQNAGRSLTKSLTVPIAGVGAASVAVTAKFQAGMSKVAAVAGIEGQKASSSMIKAAEDMGLSYKKNADGSVDQLELLSQKAKEMGAKTKFSASESAEAFNYMAMAGWKTEDMMKGIDGVMDLAAASGENLGTTSDIVTDALTAFGLSAKDSSHFADVLAAASSNANTNVSMMGETFKYAAPVAGSFGYSVEDVSTAIGLMANSGIKASMAGTSLRSLFKGLQGNTKRSKEALDDLGISLTDKKGNMKSFDTIIGDLRESFSGLTKVEKNKYAADLAGTTGMQGLLAIVNASEKDYKKLKGAIENCDGSSKRMRETMEDNLPGALTKAKSALEGLGLVIGEAITPFVTKVVEKFTKFVGWLSKADEKTVKFVVGLGAILAAIGPLLIITGTLARNVLSLMEAYKVLSGIMRGKTVAGILAAAAAKTKDAIATGLDAVANLRYKFSLSGIASAVSGAASKILAMAAAHKLAAGAALGVVGAVIGFIVYMKKTGMSVDDLKKKISTMFNDFSKNAPEIFNKITSIAGEIIKNLPSVLSTVLENLGPVINQGMEALKKALPDIADWFQKDLPKLIAVGTSMITNIIDGFAQSMPQLIAAASDIAVKMIDQFFNQAPKYIEAGSKLIVSLIQGFAEAVPQLVEKITNLITQYSGPVINSVIKVILLIADAFIKNLPVILSAITEIIIAIANAFAQNAPAIVDASIKIIWALAKGLVKASPQILVAVGKIAIALIKAILVINSAMQQAGIKLIKSLMQGILSKISQIAAKCAQAGKNIVAGIKRGIGNLIATGREWILSLWSGIKTKVRSVISNAVSSVRELPSRIKGALTSLYSAGSDFIQGLWDGMKAKLSSVISWARDKVSALPGAIKKVLGIGSPSWITRQYGEWFVDGLKLGMEAGFKPLMRTVNSQIDKVVSAYNPLSNYDFGIGKSIDVRLLDAINGMYPTETSSESLGNVINQNISIEGVEDPVSIVEEIARQLKISMRTI